MFWHIVGRQMSFDRADRHPYLRSPGPIPFAHRGGALDAPENTIEAFEESYALGYRWMETDVHLSADGVLVSFHDPDLDRVTDRSGRIADLTWEEIRTASVEGSGTIPTMAELFERIPDARFNIDAKAAASLEPLVQLIIDNGYEDRACVGSFFDNRLLKAQRLGGPGLCTSAGSVAVVARRILPVQIARRLHPGAKALQVPARVRGLPFVDRSYVVRAHAEGIDVHVWTVDEPDEMHRLLDMDVDGIMTDRPRVLKDVFVERGLWVEPDQLGR